MLVVDQCTCIMHAPGHRHACGGPVHMYNACTRSQTCLWWTSAHVQCMHKVTDMHVVDQCTCTMHAQEKTPKTTKYSRSETLFRRDYLARERLIKWQNSSFSSSGMNKILTTLKLVFAEGNSPFRLAQGTLSIWRVPFSKMTLYLEIRGWGELPPSCRHL